MTERQPHPVADIFPMMSELEFSGLVDDIKLNGLREPVWLHQDGRIIDGRNRFRACSQLGVEVSEQARTCRIYQGDDDGLVAFVVSLNLHRRHLDSDQRAMVGARIANLGEGRPSKTAEISAVSQSDVSDLLKVSADSIQAAKKVLASEDKDLIKEAEKGRKDGGLSISAAAAAAGLAEGKRKQFLAQADRDRTARMAKQMKRDEAEARQAIARLREPDPISEPVTLPVGLYQSVVIDPPWPVQKSSGKNAPTRVFRSTTGRFRSGARNRNGPVTKTIAASSRASATRAARPLTRTTKNHMSHVSQLNASLPTFCGTLPMTVTSTSG